MAFMPPPKSSLAPMLMLELLFDRNSEPVSLAVPRSRLSNETWARPPTFTSACAEIIGATARAAPTAAKRIFLFMYFLLEIERIVDINMLGLPQAEQFIARPFVSKQRIL